MIDVQHIGHAFALGRTGRSAHDVPMRLRRLSPTPIVPTPDHVTGWDGVVASDDPPAVINAKRASELLPDAARQVA